MVDPTWGYAFYVFSPGTDGKNFELAPPGLSGEIDWAMAGAEIRAPEREKTRRNAPVEGAIFFPSVVGTGKLVFEKPIGQGPFLHTLSVTERGKNSFLAHVLGYGRGKNSRRPD